MSRDQDSSLKNYISDKDQYEPMINCCQSQYASTHLLTKFNKCYRLLFDNARFQYIYKDFSQDIGPTQDQN